MSTEQDVFVLADQELLQVVQQIAPDQWDRTAPEWLSYKTDQTLRDLLNYHAYDEAFIPDTLAGRTIEEVGDTFAGDLLGDDPAAAFAVWTNAGIEAVRAIGESGLDTPVHLSYGDFPAREYLQHISTFRGFRSYTISVFLGLSTAMNAELVDGLWDIVAPEIDNWREMGVFGPAVEVPADADKQTELLGLVGFLRPPSSTAE